MPKKLHLKKKIRFFLIILIIVIIILLILKFTNQRKDYSVEYNYQDFAISENFDAENKVYERYARKKEQTDWTTGETITTKNIIITFCDNYTLSDTENKGRQGLKNIGTFDGYYITNGKAIKIKCTKNARDEKTVYKDLNGNTIEVNDGNTFVNICPTDAKVEIQSADENNSNT